MNQPGQDEFSTSSTEAEIPQQKRWRRRLQVYAAIGWVSFLVASFATMLFFAFVDPASYQWMGDESLEKTRMTGYGIGFFFFWSISALTGFIVAYVVRSTRREARRKRALGRKAADG